jgi:hypothetical protein
MKYLKIAISGILVLSAIIGATLVFLIGKFLIAGVIMLGVPVAAMIGILLSEG